MCFVIYQLLFGLQEDLTVADTEEILEDLKNDRAPKPGPRYVALKELTTGKI